MIRILPFLIVLLVWPSVSRAEVELRDGDIIFQVSTSSQSLAIQRATRSPYSHMGMLVYRNGKPFVLEASATVRFTSLTAWISRGEGGHYVVKRLRETAGRITPDTMAKVRAYAHRFLDRRYDLTFEWSDSRIYCSELVWKIYAHVLDLRIGELQTLREFDLSDPAVQAKIRERYGVNVPLDEPVISPAAMFNSPLLELVVEQ
ncbi:MAG: YiiX family permuted papain-like enzyme [Nitrospira sp.]|nr:YiiX family permuted papain-like enzyme [Nitrospira sp.]